MGNNQEEASGPVDAWNHPRYGMSDFLDSKAMPSNMLATLAVESTIVDMMIDV